MAKSATWTVDILIAEDPFSSAHLQPMLARFPGPVKMCWSTSPPPMPCLCADAGPSWPPRPTPPIILQINPQRQFQGGLRAPCLLPLPVGQTGIAPAGPALGGHLGQPEIFSRHRIQRPTPACKESAPVGCAGILSMPPCPGKLCPGCLRQERRPGFVSKASRGVRPRFLRP